MKKYISITFIVLALIITYGCGWMGPGQQEMGPGQGRGPGQEMNPGEGMGPDQGMEPGYGADGPDYPDNNQSQEPGTMEPDDPVSNEDSNQGHEHEEVAPPPKDMTYDKDQAVRSYNQNCAGCHGVDMKGSNYYPSLERVGLTHDKDSILYVIKYGPGAMPANLVTGDEAENLAKWLWTKR